MRRTPLDDKVLAKNQPALSEVADQIGRKMALISRFSAGRQKADAIFLRHCLRRSLRRFAGDEEDHESKEKRRFHRAEQNAGAHRPYGRAARRPSGALEVL
jgi:hypothetical protein